MKNLPVYVFVTLSILFFVCLLACSSAHAEGVLRLSPDADQSHSGYVPEPEPMYAPQTAKDTDHNFQIRYRHWQVKHDTWVIRDKQRREEFYKNHPYKK